MAGQALGEVLRRYAQPEGRGEGLPALLAGVERAILGTFSDRGAERGSGQGQGNYRDQTLREMEKNAMKCERWCLVKPNRHYLN